MFFKQKTNIVFEQNVFNIVSSEQEDDLQCVLELVWFGQVDAEEESICRSLFFMSSYYKVYKKHHMSWITF